MPVTLSPQEIQRYKRHLVLHEVGGQGQQKLKAAKVLVVGAGGLGSPVIVYLAAAGIGTIGVIDDDTVSLDNLQRQIVHGTPDVGRPKAESAADAVRRLNPNVTVETHNERLTAANALAIIGRYDLVADGSDNFSTRYLVSDACYFARRPLVSAAIGPFDGYLSTYRPYDTAPDGNPFPTYRCVFPEAPPAGFVPNCAEVGVLGAIAGVLGTLMATEILKEVLGIGESLAGRLVMYESLAARFQTVSVGWDPDNPLTGRNPWIKDLSVHSRAAA